MNNIIESLGPLAQSVEQLTLNQRFFKKGQNPLDKIFSKSLYLGDTLAGGEYNVDTKIISAHLNNKGGGTFNEDAGGNN